MTTTFNPYKLRVNGQVYENGNGESARDRLFRALAEKHEARAAMILARDDDDAAPPAAPQEGMGTAGKFLKDVGVDVDKMQEREEKRVEKAEARAEVAEKARLADRTADRSDGMNPIAIDLAKRGIDALVAPRENPIMKAVETHFADKMVRELTGERPSAIQEMTNMVDGWAAMMAMVQRLSPAPAAAAPVGLSPEKTFDLEIKKLETHLELEKYRADKDAQVAEKKASAWKEVAEVLQKGLDSVGRSLGEAVLSQMASSNGDQPAAARPRPEPQPRQTVEPTPDSAACPDCGEEAIMLTQGMINRVKAGGEVQATCTNCGRPHLISANQPASRRAEDQTMVDVQVPMDDWTPAEEEAPAQVDDSTLIPMYAGS